MPRDKFGAYRWLVPNEIRLYHKAPNLLGDNAVSCIHANFGGICVKCINKKVNSEELRGKSMRS